MKKNIFFLIPLTLLLTISAIHAQDSLGVRYTSSHLDYWHSTYSVFSEGSVGWFATGRTGVRSANYQANNHSFQFTQSDMHLSTDLFVDEEHIYSVDRNFGLTIINKDIHRTVLGNWEMAGHYTDILVDNGVAYLADWNGRILAINVSDPASPAVVPDFSFTISQTLKIQRNAASIILLVPPTVSAFMRIMPL